MCQQGWQLCSGVLPEAESGNLPHLGLISCNVEAAFKPGLGNSPSPVRQLLMVITGCLSLCLLWFNVGLTCVLLVLAASFNTHSVGSLQLGNLIICNRSCSVLHSLCLPSASRYWTHRSDFFPCHKTTHSDQHSSPKLNRLFVRVSSNTY